MSRCEVCVQTCCFKVEIFYDICSVDVFVIKLFFVLITCPVLRHKMFIYPEADFDNASRPSLRVFSQVVKYLGIKFTDGTNKRRSHTRNLIKINFEVFSMCILSETNLPYQRVKHHVHHLIINILFTFMINLKEGLKMEDSSKT